MKGVIVFLVFCLSIGALLWASEPSDPYQEGMHWDYSIRCEEGFLWKHRSSPQSTIPLLHSDGTHVRCGEKRH